MTESFDLFDIAYACLATLGMCNGPGGGEYIRVRLEWESYPDGQRPDPIPFITDRANYIPDPDAESDYSPGPVTDEAFSARWQANMDSGRLDVLEGLIDALKKGRTGMTEELEVAVSLRIGASTAGAPFPNSGTFIWVPGTSAPGTASPTDADAAAQAAAMFGGVFGGGSYQRLGVGYPASLNPFTGTNTAMVSDSVAAGVDNLHAKIKATLGNKIIGGVSQGAVVVDQELLNLMKDPDAPPANALTFICAGDPIRAGGVGNRFWAPGVVVPVIDYKMIPVPDTQYSGIVIVQEYDGAADMPPGNLQTAAGVNAIAGFVYLHCALGSLFGEPVGYQIWPASTPSPAIQINKTTNPNGGVVETWLLPTWPLPLMDMFPAYAQNIGSYILLNLVNSAYNRAALNYNPTS